MKKPVGSNVFNKILKKTLMTSLDSSLCESKDLLNQASNAFNDVSNMNSTSGLPSNGPSFNLGPSKHGFSRNMIGMSLGSLGSIDNSMTTDSAGDQNQVNRAIFKKGRGNMSTRNRVVLPELLARPRLNKKDKKYHNNSFKSSVNNLEESNVLV